MEQIQQNLIINITPIFRDAATSENAESMRHCHIPYRYDFKLQTNSTC